MIFSNLPEIYKLEIEHPLFKDSGEKKIDTLNKIVRMLGVQFKDEKDRKDSAAEWVLFCQDFRLTAPEIVEAYTMALKKELKIFDENKAYKSSEYEGEFIKIYPNLSLITAGEILNAYIEHKRIDKQWEIGKKAIEKYFDTPVEATPEQRKARNKKLWEDLKTCVSENKPCIHASYFYERLIKKGYFKNFVGNTNAQWILIKKKMLELLEQSEVSKKQNKIVNAVESNHIRMFCKMKDYQIPETSLFAFNLFYHRAVSNVKNDLVYNHVKKLIKKNSDETGNEMSDSNISEEQK